MKTPFFSIIVPTYNSAKTLEKCFESICSQEYKDYEVVVVDGNSTDNTVEIVKAFDAAGIERLRWLSEKDQGVYDAMNKGLEMAGGKWVYFLGSDDFFYNNLVLQHIHAEIVAGNRLDVVYGNVHSSRFNGLYDGEFDYDKIYRQNICHQAIFFKKKVFDRTGKFNLAYNVLADWDNNLKWFLSPLLNKKYVEITIAEYSDGGYSSVNNDNTFHKHLPLNFLKYGAYVLKRSQKYLIWKKEMDKALETKHKKRVLLLFFYLYYVII